ncbi:MAG: tetratricopeptide repeat protein [Elusimicrobia bacterium]|nr:tetratricopeptide repeat protein [Elusimicrobiota bacterium]
MTRTRRWAALVAAVVFIACLGVLRNQFVSWDDDGFLYQNPYFRGLGWTQLRWMFTTFLKGPYQPLVWMSYAADYLLWGMDPAGFHLTSLLWHCANSALVFLACRELLQASAPQTEAAACSWGAAPSGGGEQPPCGDGASWGAAFAALAFALHPLRVEPVAWAAARRDLMGGFFCLCALLSHLRGRAAWTFACYGLSLLCKPAGIGLPLVLAVLDSAVLERRVRWQALLPCLLPAAAAAALAWHGQAATGAMRGAAGFGWPQRLAQAGYGHAFYLVKTLWPSGLVPLHEFPLRFDPLAAPFAGSAVLGLAAAAAAFLLRRRLPAVWAAWLCYLILLAPVLGVVKYGTQLVADRYSYLPCVSWSALAGAALLALWRRREGSGRLLILSGTALVCLLMGLTAQQIRYWRDSETLYRRVLQVDPGQAMARNNLGLVYSSEGRMTQALEQFHLALEQRPRYATARNNLGSALLRLGRLQEAEAEFRAAMADDPGMPHPYNNIGLILAHRKRYREAVAMFETALSLDPGFGQAAANREEALRRMRPR